MGEEQGVRNQLTRWPRSLIKRRWQKRRRKGRRRRGRRGI
jgi:hypothetical protein